MGAVLAFVTSAEVQLHPIKTLVDGLVFDGTTTITYTLRYPFSGQ